MENELIKWLEYVGLDLNNFDEQNKEIIENVLENIYIEGYNKALEYSKKRNKSGFYCYHGCISSN